MVAFSLAKREEQTTFHEETHQTASEPHPPAAEDHGSGPAGELKQIADALWELRGLLEKYAPAWYTKQYDEKAASALRCAGRF